MFTVKYNYWLMIPKKTTDTFLFVRHFVNICVKMDSSACCDVHPIKIALTPLEPHSQLILGTHCVTQLVTYWKSRNVAALIFTAFSSKL